MSRSDEGAERLAQVAASALLKGKFDRALEAFEALIALEPSVARHRLRAADCLARLHRTADAVERYCQAARLYQGAGRETQAHAVWRIAHALDPASHDAALGLLAAEAALAAPGILRSSRPRAEVRIAEEEVTPVEVRVDAFALQTSRDAIREELSHKQQITAGSPVAERAEDREDRVRSLERELADARRFSLDAALAADIARARRFGIPLAVIVVDAPDLDGARVRGVAQRCLRVSDAAGLLPGGRLVVSALGASESGARRVAAKLRQALLAVQPPPGDVSAGIALLPEEVELDRQPGPRELIAIADAALERAIEAGHRTSLSSAMS